MYTQISNKLYFLQKFAKICNIMISIICDKSSLNKSWRCSLSIDIQRNHYNWLQTLITDTLIEGVYINENTPIFVHVE